MTESRTGGHIPVLAEQTVELLSPRSGETVLDCTAGVGGHAAILAEPLGPSGVIIVNDLDPANLRTSIDRMEALEAGPRVVGWRGNFVDAPRLAREAGLGVDVLLADLGFASTQVDDAERGLSFMRDGPLDMRLDPTGPVTAKQLVNTLPEQELADVLFRFGEERASRRIASKIVEVRGGRTIETTSDLATIVRSVLGGRRHERIDPATRTFQALRIAVNDELGNLGSLLEAIARGAAGVGGSAWLNPGARVAIISFHSLEDRLVKRGFRELVQRGLARAATRRPIEASDAEKGYNPRSRSAKLRVIELADRSAG
ncbi:MAG: 16S rRNA (cytosine(1402)-N(4))-methyltransferase RsmH [Phycisphaerales bacterium]